MLTPWTTYRLAPTRYVLELDDRATPPGLALELELHLIPPPVENLAENSAKLKVDSAPKPGRTVGLWRLSQTGQLLAAVVGRAA